MLLNKLPVLDSGYVAYLDSSGNIGKLNDVALEFFKKIDGKFLTDISTLTLVIKCPLFVQLNMSMHDFKIVVTPTTEVEAFRPNVGEIGSPNHETNKLIADDMNRTTEAMLINPRAYQMDGCDRFVSQVMMPVSTYTTLIVHGSYNEWRRFCHQQGMPSLIKSYADMILQIMQMEWR
jgi:hypothetical protein